MNIYDKINAGHYKVPVDEAMCRKPAKPAVFNKRGDELTAEECQALPGIKANYDAALAAHKAYWEEHRKQNNQLHDQFYADLCEENNVPADHPFIQKLYSLAYQHGHSSGYNDIACSFDDMLPLWDEAQKMLGLRD